jgi:hypothetical protein
MRRFSWFFLLALVAAVAMEYLVSTASFAQRLTRGPYLQLASETEITIVWHTLMPGRGQVDYGVDAYSLSRFDRRPRRKHVVTLTGLRPGTTYRYRIRGNKHRLREGLQFTTNKPNGASFRFAVFGDSGSALPEQYALAARIAANVPDLVLHTGDIVYPNGAQREFDECFFRPYGSLLERVVLWPAPGNHDLIHHAGRAYFDNFALPRNGPAGLAPERVYSFAYGDALFASVDSNLSEETLRQRVAPWLLQTLGAGKWRWRFVFFHHPPYSTGMHGPDQGIRRALVPAFQQAGVDVVFNGHDHAYERSRPLEGVLYIVTGAGGSDLYAREHPERTTARYYDRKHSFTLVEVEREKLRLRQIASDGSLVDEVSLSR